MLSNFLIKKFIKNNDDINDNKVRIAYGNLGGTVGIIINHYCSLLRLFVDYLQDLLLSLRMHLTTYQMQLHL